MTPSQQPLPTPIPALTDISRYCESDEIAPFLQMVSAALDTDYLQLVTWSTRSARLIECIAESSGPALKEIHDELNQIEMERFLLSCSVAALHQACTHYRDVLSQRVMKLVSAEMAADGWITPEIVFSLISMGSDGRSEQTLITDQDNLLVYADGGGEQADTYFQEFAVRLVDRLEEAGFKRCNGDIMPTNPFWRGSVSQWHKRLLSIVRYEVEDAGKNMMDLIVLSDARFVAGNQELAEHLIDMIRTMEREYFQVLWGMARAATEMKLALGFLKRIWTEGSGEHKGEFNVKLLAWAPLVMNIRILAINQSIPATSTVERIAMLEKEGSFSATFAQELIRAYQILTRQRILIQIKNIKGIQNDSYYLNPYQLPSEEREHLRHAMIKIEELQTLIHTNFHIV
ncbi:MAG TPA: nucleotidyltransferase [Desulfuromonadales bacterium]|nr:nucleotidyltransferase [Desulfuromonadales bacterium]